MPQVRKRVRNVIILTLTKAKILGWVFGLAVEVPVKTSVSSTEVPEFESQHQY